MRRPCAFAAVALVAGTVAGSYVVLSLFHLFILAGGLFVAFALLRRHLRLRAVLLFASLALVGAVYLNLRTPTPESSDITNFIKRGRLETTMKGRVESPVTTIPLSSDADMYRFDIAASSIELDSGDIPVSGKVRVYVKGRKEPPQIQPGNVVKLKATLCHLPCPTNPGQTDYRFYYEKRKISARAYVGKNDSIDVADKTTASWPRRALHAVRQRILTGLGLAFHEENSKEAALLGAVLVGERAALDESVEELYLKTGTFHFFALSGLHVAIFAFFLWWTLALLPIPRNVRVAIVMAALVAYCFIGGARISLVRATIMGLLYFGAEFFWRQRDPLNILGASAVLIILINPFDVFSLGFQLSFVALLSILAFRPLFSKLRTTRGYLLRMLQRPEERTGLDRVRAFVGDSFVTWAYISMAAWLGVAPLVAYHFHIVTPFSILINVLIFPGIWALLVLGILTVICSLIAPPAAPWLAGVVSLLIGGIQWVLELFSSWPSYFYIPNRLFAPVSLPWLLLYYTLLVTVAYRLRRPKSGWRYLVAAALVLVSLYLLVPWRPQPAAGTTLTALDVGRGSAFVLRTSGGATVLYDCGGGHRKVGADIIAPYLWHEGVTSIDAIVLSHPDSDHTCAVADILERFSVGAVVVSPYFDRNEDGEKLLDLVRKAGVQVRKAAPGEEFEAGGARFLVLAPTTDKAFGRTLSDNDTSLIVRVLDSGASLLFTGDAESRETAMLLDLGVELGSQVLVVPHHGGKNPFVSELLRECGAQFALISGGFNQARVAEELESTGVRVLLTEDSGALTLRHHEGEFSVETFLGN